MKNLFFVTLLAFAFGCEDDDGDIVHRSDDARFIDIEAPLEDGGLSDASEMNRDGERLIKTEFSLSIKAYVIPEFTSNIFGTTAEISKELTPSRVTFGIEGDATDKQVGK